MDPVEQAWHQALVIKCQLGDRAALEELFLRHNGPLRYYLRRMLSRDEVGDVLQDVWLTVIRRIARLRSPAAFVVWLYQIARNKAVDRRASREPTGTLEDEHSAAAAVGDREPEFSAEDAARIHEKLARLRPAHREVLLLRFIEDLSYEQIGAVTGCTPGTVRSRLHYAKLALRQLLEDER